MSRFFAALVVLCAQFVLSPGRSPAAAPPEPLATLAADWRAHPADPISAARLGSALMHRDWLVPSRTPTNVVWQPAPSSATPDSGTMESPDHKLRLHWGGGQLELLQASDSTVKAHIPLAAGWKSVGWHPGGVVIAAGREGGLELYNAETLARVPFETAGTDGNAFAFSPDGLWLAATAPTGGINLWDWAENRVVAQGVPVVKGIHDLSFSTDGRWLRVRTTAGEFTLDVRPSRALGAGFVHPSPILETVLLPDGHTTLTLHADGYYGVWTGAKHDHTNFTTFSVYPNIVVESPAHRRIAVGLPTGKARMMNTTNSRPVGEWLNHHGGIAGLAFDRTGNLLWIGGGSSLHGWDFSAMPPRLATVVTGAPVVLMAGSPDAAWVAAMRSMPEGPLLHWWPSGDTNAAPHKQVRPGSTNFFLFSRDSREILASAPGNRLARWNLATGEEIGAGLDHGAPVAEARWSRDGRYLATAGTDGSVRVWESRTNDFISVGAVIRVSKGVTYIEPDPTGRLVLISGSDRNSRLYDLTSGRPFTESWPISGIIPTHRPMRVDGVHFSEDGSKVLVPETESGARWVALPPMAAPPEWLTNMISAVLGESVVTAAERLDAVRKQVTEVEPASTKDAWQAWAKWWLSDRSTRPSAPGDRLKMPALLDRAIDMNVTPLLLEAARLDPESTWVEKQLTRQMTTNRFWLRPFKSEQGTWLEQSRQEKIK